MATNCTYCDRLSAYHDGELDSAAHGEIERHVNECPACAAQLAEMSAMSGLFAQSPRPRLSQIALYRLHNKTDDVMQRDIIRLARAVQAVAACVLVAASLWLMKSSPASVSPEVQAAPPWMEVAVQATSETNHLDVTSPAAAAYLADVSSRSDDYQ